MARNPVSNRHSALIRPSPLGVKHCKGTRCAVHSIQIKRERPLTPVAREHSIHPVRIKQTPKSEGDAVLEYFRPFRYPAATPVSLRTQRGTVKAKVIDVNDGGMRLSGQPDVQPGEKVTVSILGIPVTGIIRWVGRDRYGVLFRPKISTRQVDALRQGVKTSQGKHARFQSYPELR